MFSRCANKSHFQPHWTWCCSNRWTLQHSADSESTMIHKRAWESYFWLQWRKHLACYSLACTTNCICSLSIPLILWDDKGPLSLWPAGTPTLMSANSQAVIPQPGFRSWRSTLLKWRLKANGQESQKQTEGEGEFQFSSLIKRKIVHQSCACDLTECEQSRLKWVSGIQKFLCVMYHRDEKEVNMQSYSIRHTHTYTQFHYKHISFHFLQRMEISTEENLVLLI